MGILAFDLSKLGGTSAWCRYDPAGVAAGRADAIAFGTAVTDIAALRAVIGKVKPALVVIESCGISAYVHDHLASEDYRLIVANINEDAFLWSKTKRKTDKDDALRLARLAAANDLKPVYVPPPAVRQQRQLQRYRQHLTQRRTQIRNSLRSTLQREGVDFPSGWQGWTPSMLETISAHADEDPAGEELWRCILASELQAHAAIEAQIRAVTRRLDVIGSACPAVRLLRTIPGVGPRTAEAFVAYIGDPNRFQNGKQVTASLGLVPRQFQSGDMERMGRITKRGNKLVRGLLVEVAWLGRQVNPVLARIFDQVCAGSKVRRKTAAVAVARRLAVICWAMLRDGTTWDPQQVLRRP